MITNDTKDEVSPPLLVYSPEYFIFSLFLPLRHPLRYLCLHYIVLLCNGDHDLYNDLLGPNQTAVPHPRSQSLDTRQEAWRSVIIRHLIIRLFSTKYWKMRTQECCDTHCFSQKSKIILSKEKLKTHSTTLME